MQLPSLLCHMELVKRSELDDIMYTLCINVNNVHTEVFYM